MLATFEEAREILAVDNMLALDLETTGLSPFHSDIAVITLYGNHSKVPLILHYPRGRRVPKKVVQWLAEFPDITTHNGAGFDIMFLAQAGMNWDRVKWYDTLIGEGVCLVSGRRNLKQDLTTVVKRRTGQTIDKNIDHESWGNESLTVKQLTYCEGDIQHLLAIREEQEDKASLSADMARCLEFEQSLIPVVVQMQLNGLPVDLEALRDYVSRNEVQAVTKRAALDTAMGLDLKTGKPINLNSPKQLKTRLQEMFGAEAFPDTTAETLMEAARMGGTVGQVCADLLWFKQANKRVTMYTPEWTQKYVYHHGPQDARVHGTFRQIETETGRFSSRSPNLQQLPHDMRHVFAVLDGERLLGSTDYSAIEVRVAAAISRDEAMIQAFRDKLDIHTVVAEAGFRVPYDQVTKAQRQLAKALSFTLLFGGGPETFKTYATNGGFPITLEEAEGAVNGFFERFQGLYQMRQKAIYKCENNRVVQVHFPTGLRRSLFAGTLRPTVLLNNTVQGYAAAGLKFALKLCWDRGLAPYLNAVVHDEIVYTAPAGQIESVRDQVEACMIEGMGVALARCPVIPIAVESSYGRTWEENEENLRKVEGDVGDPEA